MIANRHMNGDARSTNRLNKPEKLFVLGFFTITECTVAVDDQVSGPRIECDYALGRLSKASAMFTLSCSSSLTGVPGHFVPG